jgi:uncharacterized membrane protein YfcA
MQVWSFIPSGFSPETLAALLVIVGASALMSGLSGFGFSAIGALSLLLLPPKLGVPLLMALSAANQLLSIRQLRADMPPIRYWWPEGPGPYLVGGLIGVPAGLWILDALPSSTLMALFGAFLVIYSTYSLLSQAPLRVPPNRGWLASSLVGAIGGVIGGFTAFPGAAVIVWSRLRQLPKRESRAIVQPYILVLQGVSLVLLALHHPQTFNSTFWSLLLMTLPVALPGTVLGVYCYRYLSDVNFRRVTFVLLGVSGAGLLFKAVDSLAFMGMLARAAAR